MSAGPAEELAEIVKENLIYQHSWTNVRTQAGEPRRLVCGVPPVPLYSGETIHEEWVLPTYLDEKWTLSRLNQVFGHLGSRGSERPVKRVTVAAVAGDSTIVYYIIHDGLIKPRQN